MEKILFAGLLISGMPVGASGQRHLTEHTLAHDSTLAATAKLDDLA